MERLKKITHADFSAEERSRQKWNNVAKPLRSLGLLEESVIKMSGIFGSENFDLSKRCVVLMCADNGVVEEGVTQSESSVTAVVADAAANGTSNINAVANCFNADVITVDAGMLTDSENSRIIKKKLSYGTGNISKEPAMTIQQASKTISAGIDIVRDCKHNGYDIIVTGEMGIGNTTTASAIASVLLDVPVKMVTGRGAGLSDEGLKRKEYVIKKAIDVNKPNLNSPIDILSKLGGYDIAGMTGLFLGGAVYGLPIVIDGFISAAAAALAVSIQPSVKEYMLCSHVSKEPAGAMLLDYIGLKPLINAQLCLGEGTGGAMLLPLLDAALAVYNSSHRFDNLPIERYVEY